MVDSIEEVADKYHVPKGFIGMILLPIVSNAAEHVTSVWMAAKGRMEMPIGICIGSSIVSLYFIGASLLSDYYNSKLALLSSHFLWLSDFCEGIR